MTRGFVIRVREKSRIDFAEELIKTVAIFNYFSCNIFEAMMKL